MGWHQLDIYEVLALVEAERDAPATDDDELDRLSRSFEHLPQAQISGDRPSGQLATV